MNTVSPRRARSNDPPRARAVVALAVALWCLAGCGRLGFVRAPLDGVSAGEAGSPIGEDAALDVVATDEDARATALDAGLDGAPGTLDVLDATDAPDVFVEPSPDAPDVPEVSTDVQSDLPVDAPLDEGTVDGADADASDADASDADASPDAPSCSEGQYLLAGVCTPLTECVAPMYESRAPTPTSDRGCALATSCAQVHTMRPAAPSGPYLVRVRTSTAPRDLTVACEMSLFGGGWTLVRRSVGPQHYPGNDNLAGTDVRGNYAAEPLGEETFSLEFSAWAFTQYLLATGDRVKWMVIDRGYLAGTYDCDSPVPPAPVVASYFSATPYTVIGCNRHGDSMWPEDPWIGAHDHAYMGFSASSDSDEHSMLYGEIGFFGWTTWLNTRRGLNVWLR